MNATVKKMTALILAVVLAAAMLSGCGGSGNGQSGASPAPIAKGEKKSGGSGRFLESEVELPKEVNRIMSMSRLSDGNLAVVGSNREDKKCYILKSKDFGGKWEKREIRGVDESLPFTAAAPDGTVVLTGYAKGGEVEGKRVDPKGKTENFSFRLPGEAEDNQLRQIALDMEGNLYACDADGSILKVHVSKGTCSRAFDTKGVRINYFYMAGEVLTAVHDEGVMLYDTKKGKQLGAESVLDDIVKKDRKLASSDTDAGTPMVFSDGVQSGSLVYANEKGIFHFTQGGSVAEQLVDGSLTSLSSGGIDFLSLVMLDENHIFLVVNGEEDKMLHFSYDEKASSMPERELTVYALDESNALRKAVNSFRKAHPDVYVKLEFGLSGDDSITLQDALSVLNTNILAKKGPDVLILDGMPCESYIEKGILADISDVVNEVDQKDGIFSGIREGSKKDGKIYAMPARILLPVVEGNKEAVKAGGSLAELAKYAARRKKAGRKYVTQPKGSRTLLRDLYYAGSALWLNADGTLNQTALTEYLKNAKELYAVDSDRKTKDTIDQSIGDGTFEGDKVGTHNNCGLITGEEEIAFGSLAGVYDIQAMCSAKKQTKADYCLMNHENVKSYIPTLMAGVTRDGNTETAKEFVKELLESNSGSDHNGFPVNRSVYDAVCKEKMDDPQVRQGLSICFNRQDSDKAYGFEFVNLKQSDVDKLTEIMEGLSKPAMTNRVIQELVLEQGDKYLRGEQSLENAVDIIMKKVNLYLAE